MSTINVSSENDIIVPTNDGVTYRGLGGNDTYILVSQDNTSKVSIIDTMGDNIIQLPEWSKIKSVLVAKTAIQITCDDMTIFTINGADKFEFEIGGNSTNGELGIKKNFEEFVSIFNLTIPESGTTNISTSKIIFDDVFRDLYEVTVKDEDDGHKFYINSTLTPDLNISSGKKYVFDQNDASISLHPLSLSLTKNGTHGGGSSLENISFYANGYKVSESEFVLLFSEGKSFDNAFLVYEPLSSDTILYYYCLHHTGLANDAKILVDNYVPVTEPSIEASLTVLNNGISDFIISNKNDPIITLERGKTYEFDVNSASHPFWIKTSQMTGTGDAYSNGVTNNGITSGKLTFTVPSDAPSVLYYNCQIHSEMTGKINIVDTNTSGVIVTDDNSSGGGYGYQFDLDISQFYEISTTIDLPPVSYDLI
tara:strand:+ start:169 stop:1437 length:1269 start_codon:yes stop_codon:yes gene_type:complete